MAGSSQILGFLSGSVFATLCLEFRLIVLQGINLGTLLLFWVLVSYWSEDLTIGHPAYNVKAQQNQMLQIQEQKAPGRIGPETFDSLYSVEY